MKISHYLFYILLLLSAFFIYLDWEVEGFDFFTYQKQNFYFQFWISLAGIIFSLITAISVYLVYKKTALKALRYVPLSFVLISFSYMIIGYHSSYCKVCSDLAFCATSHTYPNYFIIISLVVFTLIAVLFHKALNANEKIEALMKLSYGIIVATITLVITIFISIDFIETPKVGFYLNSINLQAVVYLFPLLFTLGSFTYLYNKYRPHYVYILLGILPILSFVPQVYHIFTCKDCHSMECSEFYVFSGVIMFVVSALLINALWTHLKEQTE